MIKLTVEQAAGICHILEELYGAEAKVYANYSGRGMYGATVNGISTSCSHYQIGVAVVLWVQENFEEEEALDLIWGDETPLQRSDNLGLDMIYY